MNFDPEEESEAPAAHADAGRSSLERFKLYGFQPLQLEDILFPNTVPEGELAACQRYEMTRTMWARYLVEAFPGGEQNRPKLTSQDRSKVDLEAFRKKWVEEFSKPWPQLSAETKRYWAEYGTEKHHLAWSQANAGAGLPDPKIDGEPFLIQIDLDLTDSELCKRFNRSLAQIRTATGCRPKTLRSENIRDWLVAIGAQRCEDCRGPLTQKEFVQLAVIPAAKEAGCDALLKGIKRTRSIPDAVLRYANYESGCKLVMRKTDRALRIGTWPKRDGRS